MLTVSCSRLKTLTDCFFRLITLNGRICSFITLYLYMVSLRSSNTKIRFLLHDEAYSTISRMIDGVISAQGQEVQVVYKFVDILII